MKIFAIYLSPIPQKHLEKQEFLSKSFKQR